LTEKNLLLDLNTNTFFADTDTFLFIFLSL